VTLAGFRGRWLVLYFYPRDLTPGCTKEAIGFRDVKARLDAAGASVVGISTDEAEAHRHFQEKCSLNFPLLVDHGRAICREYHALGPIGGLLDTASRITYVIDPDGVVARAYRFVNPVSHAIKVVSDVERLASGRSQGH
jgi:peroxiredoxin Q/BCP